MTTPTSPYFVSQDFLDMVDRLFPEWYVQPLKDQVGYELLRAYADTFARASLAIARTQDSGFLGTASGGSYSTGSVQLARPNTGTGAFTVLTGTVVEASASNRYFLTTADAAFGILDLSVTVPVRSIGQGPEYDLPGDVMTADGTVLAGEIDTIVLPLTSPVYAEPALSVSQASATSGGAAPVLDQLGDDRGIDRLSGEADAPYRVRARKLPDTVSPAGIRRQLDAAFFSRNLPYDLIETWQHRYQSCWDSPLGDTTHPQQGTMLEGTFAYDDTRVDRVAGLWMSVDDDRCGYVLVVPMLPCLLDRGMAYDDPASTWRDQRTNYGTRADSAWDGPVADGPLYSSGVWDGVDLGARSLLQSIWTLFRGIKGAGVQVSVVVAPPGETALAVPVTFPPLS